MEERIGRLEANYEHLRSDLSEVKGDVRQLRQDMQQGFQRLDNRIDGLKDSVASMALTMEKAKVWMLLMCAGLLAVVARAFGWL